WLRPIDRHVHFMHEVEGADVIESCCVVAVRMGKEHCVETPDSLPQHLLPEVRPRINHKRLIFDFQKHRTAEPFVPVVDGAAHLTSAANHWHTLRCSGAQECYFQAASDC